MASIPFALRRPWLLLRDAALDRNRPDLDRLRALREPERFLWAILPHAARTFSACIALLPASEARAAAVGYLYCRILDTYEDLHPDPDGRSEALRSFAARLDRMPLAPAPPIPDARTEDRRDLVHVLLVENCDRIDAVHAALHPRQRDAIRDLVSGMAEGMRRSSRAFERQGGVLESEQQLLEYCRDVLGRPLAFTLRLLAGELSPELHEAAMQSGEMIQLANVTRDIEKDLGRGVAYHPGLRPWVGRPGDADPERVRSVRAELLRLALARAPAYRRMVEGIELPRFSFARASAVLMLLFTDRYFRSCARRAGLRPWRGPEHILSLALLSLPAVASRRWTNRTVSRTCGTLFSQVAAT